MSTLTTDPIHSGSSNPKLSVVVAVISMLHERADVNSATRSFRGEPVLSWTLKRLCSSERLGNVTILCWEDQLEAVEEIAEEHHAYVMSKAPRQRVALIDAVAAARRWADGWRGGLLSTCDFDLGFHPAWALEVCERLEGDAIVLIDPSAGLIDPKLVDRVIDRACDKSHVELCFTQAAPGLAGALIRKPLLERLATAQAHAGRLLHYMPDQPQRDPIGTDACVPVATLVARTVHSFRLDSERQIRRVALASIGLNGTLADSDAEEIAQRFDWPSKSDELPRELKIELNTTRRSAPIFWPGKHLKIERGVTSLETWAKLLNESAAGADDLRLTIGGVGDPIESELLFPVIDAAKRAGINAIQVQTDLLSDDLHAVERLADSMIDVVAVNLPAITEATYATVMGVDRFRHVLQNIAHFFRRRHERHSGVPLLVPVFTKLGHNLAEMEVWYDQWLRTLGNAVIVGPSSYAGQIEDLRVADMSPPTRRACRQLSSKMTVLCDGSIVACDQDVMGKNVVGRIGEMSLADLWNGQLARIRSAHEQGKWDAHLLCAGCREWHRAA